MLLCTATLAGVSHTVRAQDGVDEYRVKAAYIRRFGDYVSWPAKFSPDGPKRFVIGVVGKDPFGKEILDHLATLTVGDNKIVIKRFDSCAAIEPCHVLFLAPEGSAAENGMTTEQRLVEVRKRVNGNPVLLVSDKTGLGTKGSMINFYLEDNRARFEINPGEAKKAGLTINSNLLKVGKVVTTDKE
jgi:hypothetical protein